MTLTPLALRPTVDKEGTRLIAEGAAYDAQFVRIRKGLFEKLYGWVKLTTAQYLGACRSLHTWASNTGAVYLGIGTSAKFYTARSGTLVDITPVRRTVTLGTDPLNTVDGSTTVTIDDTRILDWKGVNGWISLNAAAVTAIAVAVGTHVQACFTREKALHTAVTAAETTAALALVDPQAGTIDGAGGWPA